MELWWWITPLVETGLFGMLLAILVILVAFSFNMKSNIPFIIAFVLTIPLCLGILAAFINILVYMFWSAMTSIWGPYF